MSSANFQVLAGTTAARLIRQQGFHQGMFNTLVGASGGPKWFVLSGLDQYLAAEFFAGREQPISTLGSSIGSWRHICYAQKNPVSAIARLQEAYIHQFYTDEPTPTAVSRVARETLRHALGSSGAQQVCANPLWQTHVLAVRSRTLSASEARLPLLLGLGACALANAVTRKSLGLFFDRAVFHTGGSPTISFDRYNPINIPLSSSNLESAVLASGSIPLVMEGVSNIENAPVGRYRDGGITDYHFDFEFERPDGLVLFPHFYPHITPGWYDKFSTWRRIKGPLLDKVVIIAPSAEFVAGLPFAKIPDRNDFTRMTPEQRVGYWTDVCLQSQRLADEFHDALHAGDISDNIIPLGG